MPPRSLGHMDLSPLSPLYLYPAEAKKKAEKASKRGTGRGNERLYPAEAMKKAEKTSKRGTGRGSERLYPAEAMKKAEKTSKRGTGKGNERLYPAGAMKKAEKTSKRGTGRRNVYLYPVQVKQGWKACCLLECIRNYLRLEIPKGKIYRRVKGILTVRDSKRQNLTVE